MTPEIRECVSIRFQIKHHKDAVSALEEAMEAMLEIDPYPSEAYAQVKRYRDHFMDTVGWLENKSK